MKKRLVLVFIVIILMPIAVIAVMGINSYKNSKIQLLDREKDEARNILQMNDRLLQNTIRLIEMELGGIPLNSGIDINELRSSMNRERLVKQAFIINKTRNFIYPSAEMERSEREEDFLEEAESVELISNLETRIIPGEDGGNQSNWYTWFMGDGINFVYFKQVESEIRGYVVERYALISQLINVLPQSGDDDELFKILLTDARGNLLYQWGGYDVGSRSKPLFEYSLSEPLGSWRLFYYYNADRNQNPLSENSGLILIAVLPVIAGIIIVLAFYFYRENSREMKTAGQKVTFVNQVSHELKTPLTNIRLYSELLQNILTEKKELEFLNIIISESSRLGRMINNVLTFNKGERGELSKKPEETDIPRLINQVLEKFNLLFKEHDMEVVFSEKKLPPIKTDSDMIEQILINIVGNAVKYGSSGKYLAIETELKSDFLIITISDRGPGISYSEKDNIFKPFFRIDNSLSQKNSGTGIGLTIARTLAEETDSVLKLEKSNIGAVFSLSIPLNKELL